MRLDSFTDMHPTSLPAVFGVSAGPMLSTCFTVLPCEYQHYLTLAKQDSLAFLLTTPGSQSAV